MSRVLIIEARFYHHIADMLLFGASEVLREAGLAYKVLTVPGILEIPSALELAACADEAAQKHFSGYIVLGTAIRGQSDHYHYICSESMRACTQIGITHKLALGNGILTVHDEAQALERADPSRKNIGGLAARACLRMREIKQSVGDLF